jgi:CO dehydrogenase/acetyl-CoA synthase epsilon subunit
VNAGKQVGKFYFADMVKRQSSGPLMIVKPKITNQKSDETKQIIKKKINPVVVPVNTIKSISNGSLQKAKKNKFWCNNHF